MTTDNKDIARRWIEAFNRHDVDALAALVQDGLVNHSAVPEAQGAAGLRAIVSKVLAAFPDASYSLEDLIADGDRVVLRVKMTGTNTGTLAFLRVPLPATGKRVESESVHILRVADGKVAEHWAGRDDIGMLRQLGHLPFSGAQA